MTSVRSLEDLFVREFKRNVKPYGDRDVNRIPLPKEAKSWTVIPNKVYAIQGIEGIYARLNQSIVKRLPRDKKVEKRVIDKAHSNGGSIHFQRGSNGKYLTKKYSPPSGSTVIISERGLDLPYEAFIKTIDGFDYVDYTLIDGKKSYIYAVPNQYLYEAHQTALALTVKSMNCFNGYGYNTWERGAIFLYVIPYKPTRKYDATKILKTKFGLDYSQEIKLLTDYWQGINLMPNINLSALSDGSNLVLRGVTISTEGYEPIDILPINQKELIGDDEGDF